MRSARGYIVNKVTGEAEMVESFLFFGSGDAIVACRKSDGIAYGDETHCFLPPSGGALDVSPNHPSFRVWARLEAEKRGMPIRCVMNEAGRFSL